MLKEKYKENKHITTLLKRPPAICSSGLQRFHFSVSMLLFQRPAKIHKSVTAYYPRCRPKPKPVFQPPSAERPQWHNVPSARAEEHPALAPPPASLLQQLPRVKVTKGKTRLERASEDETAKLHFSHPVKARETRLW